ncbi:MAG TPA: hypothetical protein VFX97_10480 [Pyrinomonadaceae bacterium]|nr:hypothetical protein [Pyrinomonadaceae bacterium]
MTIQERQNKIQSWFTSKGVSLDCPACRKNHWKLGSLIAAPVLDAAGNMVIGGENMPMVPMVCSNCAHVRLFAAIPAGLMP